MLQTFTFTIDDKTGEVAFAGTISPRQALALLPDVVFADMKRAQEEQKDEVAR